MSQTSKDVEHAWIFFCGIGAACMALAWLVSLFLPDPPPKPPAKVLFETETISHTAGRVIRESGTEFLKGVIGMDSKRKKEADKKAKEEKEKELKQ